MNLVLILVVVLNRFIVSMFVPFSEVFLLTVMEELRFDGNVTHARVLKFIRIPN